MTARLIHLVPGFFLLWLMACGEPVPVPEPEPQAPAQPVVEVQPEPEPEPEIEEPPQAPDWPSSGVFGEVAGLDGEPVSGARVRIYSITEGEFSSETDRWGRFHFRETPQGFWYMEAAADDLISFGDKRDIDGISVDENNSHGSPLFLQLKPAARLTVRVLSRHKRIPLEGAKIRVPHLRRIFIADEKGEAVLNLSPNLWNLDVSADYHKPQQAMVGFSMKPTDFEIELKPEGDLPEELENKESAPYKIDLKTVAVVSGLILDEEGDPVPRAKVTLRRSGPGASPMNREADAKGAFRFKRPDDLVSIIVSAPGFLSQHLRDLPVSNDPINVIMEKLATFYGQVVDGDSGEPIVAFNINGSERNKGRDFENREGRFALENRHPNDPIHLSVVAEGYERQDFGPYDIGFTSRAKPQIIRLKPKNE